MVWPFGKSKRIDELKRINFNLQQRLIGNPLFANINPIDGVTIYPEYSVADNAVKYSTIDDLYSIINKIAQGCVNIPLYCYIEKPEGKKYLKELKSFKPGNNPLKQKILSLKALEDLPAKDPVVDLLNNPSDTLSKGEFYHGLYALRLLHGEVLIYKERGSIEGKPRKLHLLYPQHVQLVVSQTYPQYIQGYRYIVDGVTVKEFIPKEDIIHIRDFNPSYSISGGELRGLSKLKVLLRRIARLEQNMNVSTAQLKNGGVPGVLFDKSLIGDQNAKEINDARKDGMFKFFSATGNKGMPYIASGEMGFLELGLPLADMEVSALEKIDFKKLCNVFSISDTLFNNDSAATESNVKEMRKAAVTDAYMPIVFSTAEALEMSLREDFKDKDRVILGDISEVPELQEDYKSLAETYSALPIMIPNEILRAFKLEESVDPLADKIYIKTGYTLLDDQIIPPPIPIDENNKL